MRLSFGQILHPFRFAANKNHHAVWRLFKTGVPWGIQNSQAWQ